MLDDLDRGLIHALHVGGRVPFSRVASVLGVSAQTAARRYRRLCAESGLRVVGLTDPPCTARKAIRIPTAGAGAQATDARVKPMTPATNSRLRPRMSPSRPAVTSGTANGSV
ncbi:Lrp/AsnC family transcriptional regulator [Streptomyces canus]|uniref:Lrp/AsnC family transcriptional regulator n=1 Tax=Streptomyces canus TaxID=58343 RepID=UPI00386A7C14